MKHRVEWEKRAPVCTTWMTTEKTTDTVTDTAFRRGLRYSAHVCCIKIAPNKMLSALATDNALALCGEFTTLCSDGSKSLTVRSSINSVFCRYKGMQDDVDFMVLPHHGIYKCAPEANGIFTSTNSKQRAN